MPLDPQIQDVFKLVEKAGYPDYWELTPQQESHPTAVDLLDYPGMVHAFYSMSGAVDAARDALHRSAEALRRAFGTL